LSANEEEKWPRRVQLEKEVRAEIKRAELIFELHSCMRSAHN
jgi:hypothetical protein